MTLNHKTYWPDKTTYFLTGSTFLHYPYFNEFNKKIILLEQIKKVQERLHIPEIIYSIAVNHYHLKFYLEKGLDLNTIKQYLHGGTSFVYRKKYPMKYQEMWQPAKVLRIISEKMDWGVAGYIIGNLLKHKEVNKIDELKGNIFCSYDNVVKELGETAARDLIYSVIDVKEDENNFVSFEEFSGLKITKPKNN